MATSDGKRLNKFISESGFCSRREADILIEQGKVTINGQIPELGTKVSEDDVVSVNGKIISASATDKSDRVYIAYHKPVGITCTTERNVPGNIIDAIKHKQRIFPIGRLDKPSEGLILLTSDGDIVNKILRAENAHDKEYLVTVDQPISERFIERMSRGVPILGTVTKPCRVIMIDKYKFKMVLTQGLNRQIRRMCEYLGYEVTRLTRVRIMHLTVNDLPRGQWRELTPDEMQKLNTAVADSVGTASQSTLDAAQQKSASSSYSSERQQYSPSNNEHGFQKDRASRSHASNHRGDYSSNRQAGDSSRNQTSHSTNNPWANSTNTAPSPKAQNTSDEGWSRSNTRKPFNSDHNDASSNPRNDTRDDNKNNSNHHREQRKVGSHGNNPWAGDKASVRRQTEGDKAPVRRQTEGDKRSAPRQTHSAKHEHKYQPNNRSYEDKAKGHSPNASSASPWSQGDSEGNRRRRGADKPSKPLPRYTPNKGSKDESDDKPRGNRLSIKGRNNRS